MPGQTRQAINGIQKDILQLLGFAENFMGMKKQVITGHIKGIKGLRQQYDAICKVIWKNLYFNPYPQPFTREQWVEWLEEQDADAGDDS